MDWKTRMLVGLTCLASLTYAAEVTGKESDDLLNTVQNTAIEAEADERIISFGNAGERERERECERERERKRYIDFYITNRWRQ